MRKYSSVFLHVGIQLGIYGIIIFLFSYFRLKPIYFQTVGYTYDQGRDFLKAAEIVLYKNPTFIGPTTGIAGVYHGAWWYYLLSLSFIIFGGNPISFYYFNFLVQLLTLIIFIIFTRKFFGFLTSAIISLIVACSGHLIFTSIFLGNNVMAMPAFLMLLISTMLIFDKKYEHKIKYIPVSISTFFAAGLFLGLVAEFEFAFGLMLIPAYLFLLAVSTFLKKGLRNVKDDLYFFAGLFIAFGPRILFELKNNFRQTHVFIEYVMKPHYFTPKPYHAILVDRIELFKGYFGGLFLSDAMRLTFTGFLIIFVLYRMYAHQFKLKASFLYLLGLSFLLFMMSTLYKDTFWNYYYDGIEYLLLFLGGFLLTFYSAKAVRQIAITKSLLLAILIFFGLSKIVMEFNQPIVYDGIRVQRDIVTDIQSQVKNQNNYCVKIYTPPVIPYTYDYLFLYNKISNTFAAPQQDWQNDTCWYVIEYDENNERKDEWMALNIPKKGKKLQSKMIKDVSLELWKR
ncbi:hypothetical protein BH09PAT2_BH09PAT2_08880 [soil metagenome]